ncbi:MAG: RNA polymerase sigma factor [Phycisphaerales bacterium]
MNSLAIETSVQPDAEREGCAERGGERSPGRSRWAEAERGDAWAASVSEGVRAGDHGALEALYEEWFDRALALALSWTRRDEAHALDVVQDAMIRAIRSLRRVESRTALDAWMTSVVRSAAIDALRRESRRLRRERARAPRAPEAVDGPELRDELHAVDAALRELGPADSSLLRERFLGGRTLREAAESLGTTIGVAQGRIRRALAHVRDRLREHDHD